MKRRKLLKIGSAGILGACSMHHQNTDSTPIDPILECTPTVPQMEGPYYFSNIQENAQMTADTSNIITLQLFVEDEQCQPIEKAIIEIWHADVDGNYDLSNDERAYYAKQYTDAFGACTFYSVIPGAYLNGPNNYRPKHYHIKIWVNNQERLTTQLYFVDDPFLSYEPNTPTELMLSLQEEQNGWSSSFHFVI